MEVTFYGSIKKHTNGDKIFSPKTTHQTLRELLGELGEFYGEDFSCFLQSDETCLILINGKGIALSGGIDSILRAGDKVEILPFVEAG
ncbi:MAG: MoaD/ThiS family protein [Oscillospiraceae bacterium]|nr:MoaD/ThiS family protein [Oscillospiraceae bacterium]